jgi:hypothetical protein
VPKGVLTRGAALVSLAPVIKIITLQIMGTGNFSPSGAVDAAQERRTAYFGAKGNNSLKGSDK